MAGGSLQIKAKDVVEDLRAGFDDEALMGKYQISAGQLQRLFQKLVDGGFVEQSELNARAENFARKKGEAETSPPIPVAAYAHEEGATNHAHQSNEEGTNELEQHISNSWTGAARIVISLSDWLKGQLVDIIEGAQMFVQRLHTEGARRVFSMRPDATMMSSSEKKFMMALLGGFVVVFFQPFLALALLIVGVLVWIVPKLRSVPKRTVDIAPLNLNRAREMAQKPEAKHEEQDRSDMDRRSLEDVKTLKTERDGTFTIVEEPDITSAEASSNSNSSSSDDGISNSEKELLSGERSNKPRVCIFSGVLHPKSNRFCPECGEDMVFQCSSCRAEVMPFSKYCGQCGMQRDTAVVYRELLLRILRKVLKDEQDWPGVPYVHPHIPVDRLNYWSALLNDDADSVIGPDTIVGLVETSTQAVNQTAFAISLRYCHYYHEDVVSNPHSIYGKLKTSFSVTRWTKIHADCLNITTDAHPLLLTNLGKTRITVQEPWSRWSFIRVLPAVGRLWKGQFEWR